MLSAAEKKSAANKRAYEKRKAKLAAASASVSVADVPKVPSPKYMKSVTKKQSETLEPPTPAPAPTPTPTVKKTPMTDAEKKAKRAEYNKRAYEKRKAGLTPATKSVAKKTPAKSVAKKTPAPSPSVFELMAPPKIITPTTLTSQKARLKPKPAPFIFQGQNQKLFVRDGIKYWIQSDEDDEDDEDDGESREVYDYYDKTYVADYWRGEDEFVPLSTDINYEWKWEKWAAQNQEIAKMDAMLALTPAEYAKLVKAKKGKEAYQRKKAAEASVAKAPVGRPVKYKPMTSGYVPDPPPKILTPVDEDDEDTIKVARFTYDGKSYLRSKPYTSNDRNIWGVVYSDDSEYDIVGYYNDYIRVPMFIDQMNPEIDLEDVDGGLIAYTFENEFKKDLLIAIIPTKPGLHDVYDQELSRKVGVAGFDPGYDPTLGKLGYERDEALGVKVDVPSIDFDYIQTAIFHNGKKYFIDGSDEDPYHGATSPLYDVEDRDEVGEMNNFKITIYGKSPAEDDDDSLDLDTDTEDEMEELSKSVAGVRLDPMMPPHFK
jgi:hypothetical protein